ncbi:NADH-quinone oxidoreductase subunit J [Pseudactinotalea sp. Z1739]|uniref:NADH-quinone oxidoreductase subunit J n=2 Tax=Micrococcales TaxID=85006 RepID=UPI003C7EAE25
MNLIAQTGLEISTGEAVLFWVLGPFSVLAALSLVFSRRPVRIAVAMAGVLVSLAIFYIMNEAFFLGVAQIVVYTGAIMMLFLFVIMLVGVDASESRKEPLVGQRWMAGAVALGLLLLLVAIGARVAIPAGAGLAEANAETNAVGVAKLIFGQYVYVFELTAALLITAAVGAIIYTHRQRVEPKVGQAELAERRLAAFAAGTGTVAPRPSPGVYARHNSADMPALDASGEPIEDSVTTVLRIRGQSAQVDISEMDEIEATAETTSTREIDG